MSSSFFATESSLSSSSHDLLLSLVVNDPASSPFDIPSEFQSEDSFAQSAPFSMHNLQLSAVGNTSGGLWGVSNDIDLLSSDVMDLEDYEMSHEDDSHETMSNLLSMLWYLDAGDIGMSDPSYNTRNNSNDNNNFEDDCLYIIMSSRSLSPPPPSIARESLHERHPQPTM